MLAACGAKTGLLVPDIAPDHIDATDTFDHPDIVDIQCAPDIIPLNRRTADVMFVIDRSHSMDLDIAGDMVPPSRWNVLRDALAATLPAIDSTLSLGALFFPQVTDGSDIMQSCTTLTTIDVRPARNNANTILNLFNTTQPGGGTPTAQAFGVVSNYFASQPASRDPRYIVLATDGGPNCNLTLDPNTCICTSRDTNNLPNCSNPDPTQDLPFNCLDDVNTIAAMTSIVATGIPIFVIGIDDPNRPDLTAVLNHMAQVGGRPNMSGSTSYYSVRQQTDLTSAFQSIERTIAQCTFVTERRPASFDTIHLLLTGQELSRDPSHMNGWDVTDSANDEITLFGATCDRVAHDPAPMLTVRLGCDDGG